MIVVTFLITRNLPSIESKIHVKCFAHLRPAGTAQCSKFGSDIWASSFDLKTLLHTNHSSSKNDDQLFAREKCYFD